MYLFNNAHRFMVAIALIVCSFTEGYGQTTFADNATLSSYVPPSSHGSRDFCQDVEIEIDGQFITISTTITVCCNTEHFICFPVFKNSREASGRKDQHSVTVTDSESFTWGDHEIAVKPGVYNVDDKGRITDLKYTVTKR